MSHFDFDSLSSGLGSMLLGATMRSAILIALCGFFLVVLRSRTAAVKHLICCGALYGLLLLPAIQVFVPPLDRAWRVLSTAEMLVTPFLGTGREHPALAAPKIAKLAPPMHETKHFPWAKIYMLVTVTLLVRLGFSLLRLNEIVRRSVPFADAELRELWHDIWLQSLSPFKPSLLVSPDVSVPLAVGSNILLPGSWRLWPRDKLRAVLIHELEHVRRNDPATALLASFGLCLFWMNPLLHWLRRQLAALSEEACDEVVLHSLDAERYCRILIEFASQVTGSDGRLAAASSAVAQKSLIERRLRRIFLASSRTAARGRFVKVFLLAAFVPALYVAAALEIDKMPSEREMILIHNQEEADRWEAVLQQDPEKLNVRAALLGFYSNMGESARFNKHLFWTIEHHPEAPFAGMFTAAVPRESVKTYERLKAAWEHALATHFDSAAVLLHAGLCFERDDPQRGLALIKQGQSLEPVGAPWHGRYLDAIATIYASAVLSDLGRGALNGMVMTPYTAGKLRTEIEQSNDPALLSSVGTWLVKFLGDQENETGLRFIRRAIELDPTNGDWREALDSAQAEPVRRHNLRNIAIEIRNR